ncbi:hypothetical protein ONZ51_g9607 [Trametes cubensis]|uniref:Uncharacterized protein n=1 Tax=Trametes cubensis TaxID=1111947 RepID=A0AAD7TNK5_9APHY|nr:hypothetical protein ONZ51_g9607 [Trametes cubensis]
MFWCLGCQAEFDTSRGLSSHTRTCKYAGSALVDTLRKRKAAETQERHRKKQKKLENAIIDPPEPEAFHDAPIPEPPPLPDPKTISRAGRVRKLPGHLRNMQPSSLACLPTHLRPPAPPAPAPRQTSPDAVGSRPASPPPALPLEDLVVRPQDEDAMSGKSDTDIRTRPNEYGLYRVYTVRPQRDPEGDVSIEAAFDPMAFPKPDSSPNIPQGLERLLQPHPRPEPPPFAPFANISVFTILYWQTCGDSNLKSYSQIDLLARLMQEPGFDPKDLANLDSAREERRLDNYFEHVEGSPLSVDDRWIKGVAKIRLPKEGVQYRSEEDVPDGLPAAEREDVALYPAQAVLDTRGCCRPLGDRQSRIICAQPLA